ncbi:LysR family transcriptional regulator [Marivita sp. GX14005]|uniref:LysR family transcriptional regulator n=1 Tax=Marivita sp. GX14005 TaxID=2942276 RepID=UPI002018EFB3|nr:LysR family transcriptional regulator [Marivita sp. GX14005]MCL3883101.1 LysR family transcriptional regulator [Marivita sp. GX14005]
MPQLNYHHLRYFWAVAHDGNLTRTARGLNLSQSALSVQIKQLEDQLGHALFERRGRQLHLTEAGRIALDHADAIFAAGADLMASLQDTGRPRRALRVGALATLSRNFQINFLRPILGRADVEVILRSGAPSDLLAALEATNLDVVLLNRPAGKDAITPFVSHRLADQPVSLIGAPAHIPEGVPVEELLNTRPLILPTAESGIRVDFDARADRLGLRPTIVAEADDMAMLRLLVREGIGLAILPPIVVRDELDNGRLRTAGQIEGIVETFYAITTERRFPNPLLRELIAAPGE